MLIRINHVAKFSVQRSENVPIFTQLVCNVVLVQQGNTALLEVSIALIFSSPSDPIMCRSIRGSVQ